MSNTPRGAPELVSAQATPESTVNRQIRHTEAGACHFPVVNITTTAPPGSCTDGANYIIAATATGAWAGKEDQIATAVGTNAANGWYYHTPVEGFTAYNQATNARYLYGGSSWAVDTSGGVALATTTEQLTGTDASKAATSDSVAALWEQGADIASAATISIGDGGHFHVTGTTTITDIDPATDKAGRFFSLTFDDVLTLTHSSTLILPNDGSNITTAAGDTALFKSEGSDVVRCVAYSRASGAALVGASATVPIQIACSDETTALTTGTAKVTFRMPFAGTLAGVRASVTTAPTGSVLTVDINEAGSSVLSTKLTIDAGEKTSTTAATPAVISDSALADDAEMTIDIDGVGSTIAGAGLKVTLLVVPA